MATDQGWRSDEQAGGIVRQRCLRIKRFAEQRSPNTSLSLSFFGAVQGQFDVVLK